MDEAGMALVPESYRTEDNQATFDAYENFDGFIGDMISKNGQVSQLTTELETAKKGLEGTVRLPGEDATDEQIAEYRKTIGVPESIEGYGIDGYDKIPGGKEYMESMVKAGLTPSQAKDQLAAMAGVQKIIDKQNLETSNKAVAAYKESLGEKADVTFSLAKHGIENFFPDPEVKEKVSSQIMANPELIKAYAKIGAIIKEKPMIMSLGGGGNNSGDIYESMKGIE